MGKKKNNSAVFVGKPLDNNWIALYILKKIIFLPPDTSKW